LNVHDFGAAGDGKQDDTSAFEAALKAAAQAGGNVVRVPRGNYLIQGTLDVPENVVLEGYFRAPTARTQTRGSTLLAVAGAGNGEGQPFITLHQNSMLSGLTIFYPEQKQTNPPVPYPWTSNKGPVKFTACGFWNIPTTDRHAVLEGRGHTTFNGCHFIGWGQKDREAPCLHARRGGLTVSGCDFMDRGKVQVALESEVEAALVFGNRFRGKERILNQAGERAQLGMNVVSG